MCAALVIEQVSNVFKEFDTAHNEDRDRKQYHVKVNQSFEHFRPRLSLIFDPRLSCKSLYPHTITRRRISNTSTIRYIRLFHRSYINAINALAPTVVEKL